MFGLDSTSVALFFPAHSVLRKWILLSDPEDKMAGAKVRSISCILDNLSCILIYRAADTLTYMFTFIVAKLVLIFTFSFLDGLISEFDFNLITEKNQDEMLIFKPRKKIDPHQYIVVLV